MARKCQHCQISEKYKYWNEIPQIKHSFFKIMPEDFERQLLIPIKFTECFKEKLCNLCTLIGPSGNKWRIRLCKFKGGPNRAIFTIGWPDFVKDHGIQYQDFVIFRYIGRSSFEVSIYGASGCEREGSYFAKSKRMSWDSCRSTLHDEDVIEVSSDFGDDTHVSENFVEENVRKDKGKGKGKRTRSLSVDDEYDSMSENRNNETEEESNDRGNREDSEEDSMFSFPQTVKPSSSSKTKSNRAKLSQMYYKSNRRTIKEAEKSRAIRKAESHKLRSKSPMFLITLKPTHVCSGFNFTIPKNWAMAYMLHKPHEVELRLPNSRMCWVVGCRWTRSDQCQLRRYWPQFVRENNLEEHDVCAFELVKKNEARSKTTIIVYIYRVVDEVVPLTVSRRMV